MNNLNAKDLVDQVRTILDETGITSGKWNDTEIMRQINHAKDFYVNIINTIEPTINGKTASITYVAGTELYDLPNDLDSIRRVEITSTKEKVEQISVDEKEVVRSTNGLIDSRPCYYIWGRQIGLVNVAANVTIYYLKRVPDLHYGTAVTGGTTTTLIFSATPNGSSAGDYTVKKTDDYYNGMYIDIYSGLSAPQSMLITDYAGSTRTATFAAATAHDTTSLYALRYDLPNEVDQCIIFQAAIYLCPKDRTKNMASLTDILSAQKKAMTDGLAPSKERKYVEYVSD